MSLLTDIEPPVLADLCHALPFLGQLPPDLLQRIDTSALLAPSGATAEMRVDLESRLGCHIMTYRAFPLASSGHERLHLCRLLVPACLAPMQLGVLRRCEENCCEDGVVFVAYAKPLRLRELRHERTDGDNERDRPSSF
jgi:hypothetical protein